jgi:tRNA U55 pseudouridine synthase TruB
MINAWKKSGETMDQFVSRVKTENSIKKLAYTARLDPMAKGIVPFLVEEECANIKNHLGTGKTYQVKIIYGIQTDSDDPLGIITNKIDIGDDSTLDIAKSIINYLNLINNTTFKQKYHHFSTKMLNHRRQQSINVIDSHDVSLYDYRLLGEGIINYNQWTNKIIKQIKSIDPKRNFRQEPTIRQWNTLEIKKLYYMKLSLDVSSGFFIRQLIRDMSDNIGIPLMSYNINRVNIK